MTVATEMPIKHVLRTLEWLKTKQILPERIEAVGVAIKIIAEIDRTYSRLREQATKMLTIRAERDQLAARLEKVELERSMMLAAAEEAQRHTEEFVRQTEATVKEALGMQRAELQEIHGVVQGALSRLGFAAGMGEEVADHV
jgi:hypothetical protein